jgi:hypothetical protein
MGKWADLNAFREEHRKHIETILSYAKPAMEEAKRDFIGEHAFKLWDLLRIPANRSHVSLCFDCVYVISRMLGERIAVSKLEKTGRALYQKPFSTKPWMWWGSEYARCAIQDTFNGYPKSAIHNLWLELRGIQNHSSWEEE